MVCGKVISMDIVNYYYYYLAQHEVKFLKLVMPTWIFYAKLALHTHCVSAWHILCVIYLFIMCRHIKLLRKE